MKKILFIFLAVISSQVIQAQNEIWGKVAGPHGTPLAGANIFIPESQKGTETNQNGTYRIFGLGTGIFKIQYSYLGYTSRIETAVLNNSPIEINIILEPTSIETEEVVISGGYSSTQHENAVKIDVLKPRNLKLSGSPNFTEILTQIPGVDMISKGPGVSKPVIRGLSMNDILVLNNGVRLENYQYSDHHPLGIDEYGVENAEIIKGPASLLYGSDAIGGVINFLKEKPAPVGNILGEYHLSLFSNTLGTENHLGIKGSSQRFFGGIHASVSSHSDFKQGGGQVVPNSRFNERAIQANTGYTNKTGSFRLYYDYNRQKLGLAEEEAAEEITVRGRKNEVWFQQFDHHLLSSQNKLFFGNMKLEANAAYQNTLLAHFGEKDVTEIEMMLGTFTWESKLTYQSGKKSEYIFGVQGFHQTNRNLHNREIRLLPDAGTQNYSALGLMQHNFFERLQVQAGIRYDKKSVSTQSVGLPENEGYRAALSRNYSSFSGSAGATFNASEILLFRANFSAAYRTPNLAELTSDGLHEIRFEIGNPDLIPQNAFEYDLSTHYHTRNLTFDVACFYNRLTHYIFISPTDDTTSAGDPVYRYMQSGARLYGAEAGLHFHPKPVEWLHLEITYAAVIGEKDDGGYLPFIPAGKLNAEVRVEKKKLGFMENLFLKVMPSFAFSQNRVATGEEPASGYSLFSAGLGAQVKMGSQLISITFVASNILDTKYIDHLSTLKEVGYFNPGRNFSLNLQIPFAIKGSPVE